MRSLQLNSTSKFLQNGNLSETIHLGRGCRHGDPISIEYEINKFKENADIIIEKEISEIMKSITIWSAIHLIPFGKINIIKSLLIKKIRMFCCPFPLTKKQYLKKLIYTTPLHGFIAIWHSLLETNGQIKFTS